jgi:hypothetical protein
VEFSNPSVQTIVLKEDVGCGEKLFNGIWYKIYKALEDEREKKMSDEDGLSSSPDEEQELA